MEPPPNIWEFDRYARFLLTTLFTPCQHLTSYLIELDPEKESPTLTRFLCARRKSMGSVPFSPAVG